MDLVDQLRRDAYAPYFTSVGAAKLMCTAADEIVTLRARVKAHEEVYDDHKRLVRELDVALNGEHGAAKQASLCDIVGQLTSMRREALSKL